MNTTPNIRSFGDRRSALALVVGVVSILGGTALMLTPTRAVGETADLAPNITISQTASDVQPSCLPAAMALSYVTQTDESSFVLRITATAPPCAPITAHAVIYAMPGNGVAWPQQLSEQQTFVLDTAGTTEVRFTKTCQPAQFDVVTGATPATISPVGAWHGPLLFPYDTATAQQYWGPGCQSAATTAVPTSAPATSAAPTTTDGSVGASTTAAPTTISATTQPVAPSTQPAPTTDPSDVAGETTIASSSGTSPPGVLGTQDERVASGLAVTGFSSNTAVVLGGALVVAGLVTIAAARRRG